MSRVGNAPIPIPTQVKVEVGGDQVKVKGPKGELACPVPPGIGCKLEGGVLTVVRRDDSRGQRSLHGLTRALIANSVTGTVEGFQKKLEIRGVGYRAEHQKDKVEFALGYSHSIAFPIPEGVTIEIEKQVRLNVSGIDKQQVGQVAANIRSLRPPEPYKGKGIRYEGEEVAKKAGKSGATGAK